MTVKENRSTHKDDAAVNGKTRKVRGTHTKADIAGITKDSALSNRKCFVIMPSGRHDEYGQREVEADFVYNNIIHPAVELVLGPGNLRQRIRQSGARCHYRKNHTQN